MKDNPETQISRLEEKRPEESWESFHCEIVLMLDKEYKTIHPEQAFSDNVSVKR